MRVVDAPTKVFQAKMMFVLQKLRERSLYVGEGEVFEYYYEDGERKGTKKPMQEPTVGIPPRDEYPALKRLESDGAIRVSHWGDYPGRVREMFEIELTTGGIAHSKIALIQPCFDESFEKYRKALLPQLTNENPDLVVPKFRFYKGMLHRDGYDPVVVFAEETQEFTLLRVAMEHSSGERIDAATDDIGMDLRGIYDAARRINKKVKDAFGINGFFRTEWSDKYIERTVE